MEDSIITVTDGSPVNLNQVSYIVICLLWLCYCRVMNVSVLSPQCLRILLILVSVLNPQ